MPKIHDYETAMNKIEEIRSDKGVEIANFHEDTSPPWVFYLSLSGWFNNNYFQLYISKLRNGDIDIEIPRGITDQKGLFKEQFKL